MAEPTALLLIAHGSRQPEANADLRRLAAELRGRYLVDVISYNRVRGLPFRAAELAGVIRDVISNV